MRNIRGEYIGRRRVEKAISPKTKERWYVVASRAHAVIYQSAPTKLSFVQRLENPAGELTETHLDSDRPGRVCSSAGGGKIRHSLNGNFNRHEQVAVDFARVIASTLKSAKKENRFNELVLIAEPHFLGLLRSCLPASLKSVVKEEINREFSQGSDEELRRWVFHKISKNSERRKPRLETL